MRGLTALRRALWRRALWHPAHDRERGAVSALVAIVAGTGVLLGMASVVVDVGRLYAEREQLQTGADAAAWAIAQDCIRYPDTCGDQATTAAAYADANAADGAAGVTVVCGRGGDLPTCPAQADNRTACLSSAPINSSYVEVRTETRLADGSTLLPPVFAGMLTGQQYDGSTVAACARLAWGPPRSAAGFAVTFSTCEWLSLTDSGLTFWPRPDDGFPPTGAESAIYLHETTEAGTCPAGPSGWDAPGGFGWLDDVSLTCKVNIEVDGTYGGNTGVAASQACQTALSNARNARIEILIPIYDGVLGTGTNTTYHLAGFATFVLTGYYLSGFHATSWLSGQHHCSGSERCLYGYFTRGLVPTTGELGGPDLGTEIVKLVG